MTNKPDEAPQPQDTPQDAPPEQGDLEAKCQEYLDGWKRAQADYQNLQKETEKRVADSIKYGSERLLMELLPMVDHFKFGFKGVPAEDQDSGWMVGMKHIQTNFLRILEEHGVKVIETEGKPFNPELHEAVEEVEGGESGTIAEEVTSGFMLGDKVVQVAKVKVYQ